MRIVVSGYYGCGNLGDEAVLAGLLSAFEKRGAAPRSAFTVLSAAPRDTEERHGVRAIPRMKLTAVRAAMRDADLLLSGGGSLLQDTTSARSLVYYLAVMRLAVATRTPFAIYAQGIGPLRRPLLRAITRSTLNRAAAITVRDADSAELLREIGVRVPRVEVTADPVFALPAADPADGRRILDSYSIGPGPVVGMALREWRARPDLVQGAAEAVKSVYSATGLPIALLPMHHPSDLAFARAVAGAGGDTVHVLDRRLSVGEARAVVAALSVLVGMRLHALIFAAAAGVPVVSVSYDPKVASLMQEIGQEDMNLALGDLCPDQLAQRVELALSEAVGRSDRLGAESFRLAQRALRNVDTVMAALSGRA